MRYPKPLVQNLLFTSRNPIFTQTQHSPLSVFITQIKTYVSVYMKWKKDPYFDSIDSIHKSLELKPIISVKNFFISSSSSPHENYSIPISDVSKKGSNFGINYKMAVFLKKYPSFFEEFKGPLYNLPWFRLTNEAIELHKHERRIYESLKDDILERVKKLVLMSGTKKVLPLKIINYLHWYLGLPDEFLKNPSDYIEGYGCLKIVEIEDGLKGLAVFEDNNEKVLSMMQRNSMKKRVYNGGVDEPIAFPLFPAQGMRLKQKIKDWLIEFQRVPYVSPYDDFACLNPDSDLSEKRVVGLIHEVLSLFVEHAAERKSFLCLRKYFGLPQKVHKAFVRHPHIFYLSLKNNTCTAILKEAYSDDISSIEPHPLAKVRKEYIRLMSESDVILRNRKWLNSRKSYDQQNTILDGSGYNTQQEDESLES